MTPLTGCSHEREVLDLVAIGQWPARADAALRAHVDSCASCAELASVADAVREWGDAVAVPRLPDASAVWHRAQRRARESAARAASRPVWVAQAAAVAVFVVALVWMGPGWSWYQSVGQSAVAAVPTMPSLSATVDAPSWTPEAGWGRVGLIALAAVAVVGSIIFGAVKLADDQ